MHLVLEYLPLFFAPDVQEVTVIIPNQIFIATNTSVPVILFFLAIDFLSDFEGIVAPFEIERVEEKGRIKFRLAFL
jgi:hypothetical protein